MPLPELGNAAVFLDFDGTITDVDSAQHLLERFASGKWRAIDAEYARGEIGSRVCLLEEWDLLPKDEALLRAVSREVAIDPGLEALVRALQAARVTPSVTAQPARAGQGFGRSLFAGLAAVVVLGLIALFGSGVIDLSGGSSAEASIEGIVVGNANGSLTLQTVDAVETVSLTDGASVVDDSGASIALASIEPGQVLEVRGRRIANGQFAASLINRREAAALASLCRENPERCRSLEQTARRVANACQSAPENCRNLQARFDDLRDRLVALALFNELLSRCRGGGGAACDQLKEFCTGHTDICTGIVEFLRGLDRPVRPNDGAGPADPPARPNETSPLRPAATNTPQTRPADNQRLVAPTTTPATERGSR